MNAMRYRLRTLLIVLALVPPVMALVWPRFTNWLAERNRKAAIEEIEKERAEINATIWSWSMARRGLDWTAEEEARILALHKRKAQLIREKAKLTTSN
jgi:hypothetical protein